MRKRFSESAIINLLRSVEVKISGGMGTEEACRSLGGMTIARQLIGTIAIGDCLFEMRLRYKLIQPYYENIVNCPVLIMLV